MVHREVHSRQTTVHRQSFNEGRGSKAGAVQSRLSTVQRGRQTTDDGPRTRFKGGEVGKVGGRERVRSQESGVGREG